MQNGTTYQTLLGDTTWNGDAINVQELDATLINAGTLNVTGITTLADASIDNAGIDNLTIGTSLKVPVGATVDDILTCINVDGTAAWKSDANLTGLTTQAFKQPPGAAVGKVLTSDVDGIGTWEYVPDPVITLAGDVTGLSNADVVEFVGGSTAANVHSAELLANAATDANTVSTIVKRDGSGNFSAATIFADLTGNVTGNVIGNLTGNVTGNVSGSSSSFTGPLGGDVLGSQLATVVYSVGGSSAASVHSGEQLANAATNVNTFNSIVKRDGSGGFSAGTISANLTGNVTGNVSGSAGSVTGSFAGDVTGTQGAMVVSTINGVSASLTATTNTSQALTNKTITGTSNIVDANVLRNGSTWALPLAGAAPSTNQVLTFNGTQAIWSTPASTSSVTMGGNVTGNSAACTVVGAAGNFAVVGNETVGGTLGVTGAVTLSSTLVTGKTEVRSTSQQVRLFPLTSNSEASIAFNTATGGPGAGVEWTMGQGAYGVGAGNFGMGATNGVGNVLGIDGITGNWNIPKSLTTNYNNFATVTGSFPSSTWGTNPTITVTFIKYNHMVTIIWPGTNNTTNASNTVQDIQWSGSVPSWAAPYAACNFPGVIWNNNNPSPQSYMYFSIPVSDWRINFWSVNSVSKAWANQCSVDATQWHYLAA